MTVRFWRLWILAILAIKSVTGSVFIYSLASNDSGLVKIAPSLSTRFGPSLPLNGLRGLAFAANPYDGCTTMDPPPKNVTFQDSTQPKWLALIARYNCAFDVKVKNAQEAGYDGAIVYSGVFEFNEIGDKKDQSINISSLIIDETAGQMIIENFQYTKGYVVVMSDNYYENLYSLVFLFVLICLFYLTIKMVASLGKCMIGAYQRAFRRYNLEWNILRRLETRKFKKNEPADACVICLDDYEEEDDLRILPCKHTFHSICIDQWLLNNPRCPFCNFSLKPGSLNSAEASV